MKDKSFDADKMAEDIWKLVYNRLRYMSDYKDGTHTLHSIKDISESLRLAYQSGLEDAAKVADDIYGWSFSKQETAEYIAKSIRSLKEGGKDA